MSWEAYFHPKFKAEFDKLSAAVQDELLAMLTPLRQYGPSLGRPEVDTLKDSKYTNMKELRFRASGGVWRVAFAFDPAVSYTHLDVYKRQVLASAISPDTGTGEDAR